MSIWISEPESLSDTDNDSSDDRLSSSYTPASLSSRSTPSLNGTDAPNPKASIPSLSLGLDLALEQRARKRITSSASSITSDATPPTRSAAQYTDWAVQQGVDKDLRDYPSVDPIVQQAIVNKYRALHQRIHDEGLDNCRYIEYGKEMLRYTSIFVGFLVALRYEWYMTSASLLGLFWVSFFVLPLYQQIILTDADEF
jgi:delta8-fatty-acid desaturase